MYFPVYGAMPGYMPALRNRNICPDSAMDNLPAYRLLKDGNIRVLIDLNSRCGHPATASGLTKTVLPSVWRESPREPCFYDFMFYYSSPVLSCQHFICMCCSIDLSMWILYTYIFFKPVTHEKKILYFSVLPAVPLTYLLLGFPRCTADLSDQRNGTILPVCAVIV